ncbi:cupin superfamily protein [Tenacibaculum skagerrakense]|uniref:Cupin superfamily protein n=1 Tax=Tenacibaculum skagerrakense TaxID=186571 RepID=A0A4R2NRK8_9FLAO|nr:cupin domain-containing protein [Tenacibaculum skagerrakense]TCP24028.1 cupin superfamily protein [Tenacibaculum skagerrakense]
MSIMTTETITSNFNFAEILYPRSSSDFVANFWESNFLHIKRESPYYFKNLFSIENFDGILEYGKPRGKSLRVVKNQDPLLPTRYENPDGTLNLNQLYAAYADGYTLVVNEINRYSEPINALVHNLRQELSHDVKVNAYLTPANQKALSPHYDTHDVFVLQISGKKHWNFYDDTNFKTPLLKSFQPIFQEGQLSGKKEVTIEAGDFMYVPRGLPHEAYTTDESSLHLTVGVYSTQHIDLISKALQSISQHDIDFRKALPVGFLNYTQEQKDKFKEELTLKFKDKLEKIFESNNLESTLFLINEEFRTDLPPMSDGHFAQLDKIDSLTLESKLTKRDNMQAKVMQIGGFSRIMFPGNVIKGPAQIASVFQFIAESDTFEVQEIPRVNDDNKLKLAKRLIRGGLLKINQI